MIGPKYLCINCAYNGLQLAGYHVDADQCVFRDSALAINGSALIQGSVVYSIGGAMTLKNCTFSNHMVVNANFFFGSIDASTIYGLITGPIMVLSSCQFDNTFIHGGTVIGGVISGSSAVFLNNVNVHNTNIYAATQVSGGVVYAPADEAIVLANVTISNTFVVIDSTGTASVNTGYVLSVFVAEGVTANQIVIENSLAVSRGGLNGAFGITTPLTSLHTVPQLVTVSNSVFRNNTAVVQSTSPVQGAAFYSTPLMGVTLQNVLFDSNTAIAVSGSYAVSQGGAAYVGNGALTTLSFTNNVVLNQGSAGANGGGLFIGAGNVTNCVFTGNNASSLGSSGGSGKGGGLYATTVTVTNTRFVSNQALVLNAGKATGGGLSATGATVLQNCSFMANVASAPSSSYSLVTAGIASGGAVFIGAAGSLMMTDCTFANSTAVVAGGSAVQGGAICVHANATALRCSFANNQALAMGNGIPSGGALFASAAVVTDSSFTANFLYAGGTGAASAGAVYCAVSCVVTRCAFLNNSVQVNLAVVSAAAAQGGALMTVQLSATNTTCESNFVSAPSGGTAAGGCFAADSVTLVHCNIAQNRVFALAEGTTSMSGGGINAVSTAIVVDCRFYNNSVDAVGTTVANCKGGAIAGAALLLNVTRSEFTLNSATALQSASGAALAGGCIIAIQDSLFSENSVSAQEASGAAIAGIGCAFGTETVNVVRTVFTTNNSTSSAAVLSVSFATVQFVDCMFLTNSALYGGTIVSGEGPLLRFHRCQANENEASGTSLVYWTYGQVVVDQCSFVDNICLPSEYSSCTGGVLQLLSGALNLTNSVFMNNQAGNGGAIYFTSNAPLGEIFVNDTYFIGNSAENGGAIFGYTSANNTLFSNCVFMGNNASLVGGAIMLEVAYSILPFKSCIFSSNTAVLGGAAYLDQNTIVAFEDCIIQNNTAQSGGGGVFWNGQGLEPWFINTTISENAAEYSPNIGTYALSLEVIMTPHAECGLTESYVLSNSQQQTLAVASGCTFDVTAIVLDFYSHKVVDPGAQIEFALYIDPQCTSACVGGRADLFQYTTEVDQLTLAISGPPQLNSTFCFFYTATSSASTLPYSGEFQITSPTVYGAIGNCTAGYEAPQISGGVCGTCQQCALQHYSVRAGTPCTKCPDHAVCTGQYVWPEVNYWASYDEQTNGISLFHCLPGFCPESPDCGTEANAAPICQYNATRAQPPLQCYVGDASNSDVVTNYCEPLNSCGAGRTGFMCGMCQTNYSYWNSQCLECSDPHYSLIAPLFIGNWLSAIGFHVLLSGSHSGVAKSLLYFVQIGYFVMQPADIVIVLTSLLMYRPSGGALCLFPRDFYSSFVEHLIVPLVTLFVLVASYGILLLYFRIRLGHRATVDRNRFLIRPVVSWLLSIYSPTLLAALDIVSCRQVGQFLVVSGQPALLCSGPTYHNYYVVSMVLVVVIVVCLPLVMLILLGVYRKRLRENDISERFGYVYEQYRPGYVWWEVVVLLRRAALSLFNVIPATSARTYAFAFGCTIMFALQLAVRPERHTSDALVELAALLTLTIIANANSASVANDPVSTSLIHWFTEVLFGIGVLAAIVFAIVRMCTRSRHKKLPVVLKDERVEMSDLLEPMLGTNSD
eukprot:TRINITY_DN12028_c0_g1_i1.p1 TRINITY_DN12028_c0_g1~~TRINITY_DN12028_c0_g1_i1.p1  ORF type:complete len:1626 (+),score=398.88 TRINITY_DN12028_c0_g1_i1:1351-6228(+)